MIEKLNLESIDFHLYDIIIVDENIFDLYCLPTNVNVISIKGCEKSKTYSQIKNLFVNFSELGVSRNSRLLAVGGGTIQDIATFVCSLYMRGIKWDYLPTTLLAMGDSCIGGKSSINLGNVKNLLGNFYPPDNIFIVTDFLETLPEDQISSGIGELYHYAYLRNKRDYTQFQNILGSYKTKLTKPDYLGLIKLALTIKQEIIQEDEFDKGRRLLNNWGHTVGHALEGTLNFSIPHGQAVLLGIKIELLILQMIEQKPIYEQLLHDISPILGQYGYKNPIKLSPYELFEYVKKDKKNRLNQIAVIKFNDFRNIEIIYLDNSEYFSCLKYVMKNIIV